MGIGRNFIIDYRFHMNNRKKGCFVENNLFYENFTLYLLYIMLCMFFETKLNMLNYCLNVLMYCLNIIEA